MRRLIPKIHVPEYIIGTTSLAKFYCRFAIRQLFKRVLKKGVTVKLPTGLPYYCAVWDKPASEVYYSGCDVDYGSEELLYNLIKENSTFIDVGAHTGYYSLYMLPKANKVYAFELDPKAIEILEINLTDHGKAQIVPKAVYHSSGKYEFVERGGGFSYLSEVADERYLENKSGLIDAVSIDDFFDRLDEEIGAIKIDIDGGDLEVLRGARKTIKKHQPYVLTELISEQYTELNDFLNEIDYVPMAYTINNKAITFGQLQLEKGVSGVKMFLLSPKSQTEFVCKMNNELF